MSVSSHAYRWGRISLVLLVGCRLYQDADDVGAVGDASVAPGWRRVAVIDPTPTHDLDILFVVDTSAGMAAPQAGLIAGFAQLINWLGQFADGMPDLHVGVVSGDLGAGRFALDGCVAPGDAGALQVGSPVGACASLRGRYIRDVADLDQVGGRDRNYAGSLADTFACLADLGDDGCRFQQHLESMRRALDGSDPGNAGFLRPDAHLLVVVLADQDDCSTRDGAMFDPAQDDPDDPLGTLSTFRCFEFGVACQLGDRQPRTPGLRAECTPDEGSRYMFGVEPYVEFLRGLKPDLDMVTVVTIAGWADSVTVGSDPSRPDRPVLEPVCLSTSGSASPAVRLTGFTWALPRSTQTSVCDPAVSDGLINAAILTMDAMEAACVSGPVTGGIVELGERCRGFDVLGLDTATERRTLLPMCVSNDGAVPCLRFEVDLRCPFNESNAAVVVERGSTTLLPGTKVVLECPAP